MHAAIELLPIASAGTVPIKVPSNRPESEKPDEDGSPSDDRSAIPPATRGAFRKGALLAGLLIIPGLAALLHWLARDPLALSMHFDEVFATVAVFAGLPALLVFGGIGKNLARQRERKRSALVLRGAMLGALAALSLALLAAVPTATLPTTIASVLTTMSAAACIGVATGALLGLWIFVARRQGRGTGAPDEA